MSSKEKWIKCGWNVGGSKWKLLALVAFIFIIFANSLNEQVMRLGLIIPAFLMCFFTFFLGFVHGDKSSGSGSGSGGGSGCGGGCGGGG